MSDPAGVSELSREAWPAAEQVSRFWKRETWLGQGRVVADGESHLVTNARWTRSWPSAESNDVRPLGP